MLSGTVNVGIRLTKHLMTGSKGNSEFCFGPRPSMTMTESQESAKRARILNLGRKNVKFWKFFLSNFGEKSINANMYLQ